MNVSNAYFSIVVALTVTLSEFTWASDELHSIDEPNSIEVFTGSASQEVNGGKTMTVYTIDRIDQLQQALSQDLPSHPEKARQLAVQRFQQMDAHLNSELENAAKGLVQAQHYGIDRYPAIVFEGKAVVYGITDVHTATRLYRQWQADHSQP